MTSSAPKDRTTRFSLANCAALAWGRRALILLGFLTVLVIATPAVVWITPRVAGSYDPSPGDTLVVLGAGTVAEFPDLDTYWRCVYAVRFFRSGSFQRIVLSGGSPSDGTMSVATVMANFLKSAGIPADAMLLETASHSTRENAVLVGQLLSGIHPGKVMLLTSDYHTRRARAAFQRAGMDVDVVPVPYVEKLGSNPSLRPMLLVLELTEYAKILWYRFKGWT